MEPTNQISIESFSYAWLNNINPPFDFDSDRLGESLRHAPDANSFIEINPDFFSIRWTDLTGFDFPFPTSSESSDLVHADQIFSNGRLLPFCNLKKKETGNFSSDSPLTRSVSVDTAKTLLGEGNCCETDCSSYSMPLNGGSRKVNLELSRGRRNSPGKMLRKYLNFLIPLYRTVQSLKTVSLRRSRSCRDSPLSSAGTKSEFSIVDRNRGSGGFDWEFECCIRDAVLHCKKSTAEA